MIKLELHIDRVLKRVAQKKRRVLFRLGGYLRTTMQRSMRYSSKRSKRGKPPHANKRTGAHLRKGIRFNVDLSAGSVVCGPDLRRDSKVISSKTLPSLLDQGGIAEGIGGKRIRIEPRPFVKPALEKGIERFTELLEKEKL